MAKNMDRLPVTLPEFERVFRTVHGVLMNEKGDLAKGCLFFGIIGAAILRTHHKLDAMAVAGFAAYKLDQSNDILVLGTQRDGVLTSENNGFHCWVQCQNWLLDFTSPLFQEMLTSAGLQKMCERKMFQKPVPVMKNSLSELRDPGDFLYCGNQDLTQKLIDGFFSLRAYEDILNICVQWYRPLSKKMQDVIGVGNAKGEVKQTKLSSLRLNGAW